MHLNEVLRLQDQIDRGLPCESCGAVWVDAPEIGKGARKLDHQADCAYNAALEELGD